MHKPAQTHAASLVHIEAHTDSQITPNMLLPAHLSVRAHKNRPSYLNLTYRYSSPPALNPSLLSAFLPWLVRMAKGWEGGGLAQPLFPSSAGWLSPSHLAESASPAPVPAALALLGKLSAG